MGWFFGWIVLSVVAGAIGSSRTIGFFGALIISLILSPLIGLIVAFASQRKSTLDYQNRVLDEMRRRDPRDEPFDITKFQK